MTVHIVELDTDQLQQATLSFYHQKCQITFEDTDHHIGAHGKY
jgi:hypothetical protein